MSNIRYCNKFFKTEEQAKLNEENSMTLIGKFIKKILYKNGNTNV